MAFVDNPHAPMLYADAASGWGIYGGNVRITFESMSFHHDEPTQSYSRVVVGRVVMPLGSAVAMAQGILAFAEEQRRLESAVEQSNTLGAVN